MGKYLKHALTLAILLWIVGIGMIFHYHWYFTGFVVTNIASTIGVWSIVFEVHRKS